MPQSGYQAYQSKNKNSSESSAPNNSKTDLAALLEGHEMVGKMNSGPVQRKEVLRQAQQPVRQAQKRLQEDNQTHRQAPRSLSLSKWTDSKRTSDSMPKDVQTKMENSFATSFADVKIHKNDNSATEIGALAYTQGNNVHFAPGQFNPSGSAGQELLGHELTHVVQQRQGRVQPTKQGKGTSINDNPSLENEADAMGKKAANGSGWNGMQRHGSSQEKVGTSAVQRKIVVDGNAYTPEDSYKDWLRTNYSEEMVELIMSMHNSGNPPDYNFSSFEQMGREVQTRYYAIEGMGEANNGSSGYATGSSSGQLNTSYWDKVGPYHFQVKSGVKPSEAIETIFDPSANNVLECNSMMVAIQYRAILKTLGASEFDTKFPNGAGILISPHHQPRVMSTHPIWDKNLYKTVAISSSADLLPGDWIYFENITDYIVKHPGGAWSGEHTMYMGNGKFRGFGIAELTESQLLQELLDAYNSGLPTSDKKDISDVPGLRNYARRPVISEIEK